MKKIFDLLKTIVFFVLLLPAFIRLLQIIALIIIFKADGFLWWPIIMFFLYIAEHTHVNVNDEHGPNALKFWKGARSLIYVFNILSVVIMYIYIFFF
jgi:hypothetical protein